MPFSFLYYALYRVWKGTEDNCTYSTQHIKLEGYIPFMLMLNFVISANINYAFISRLRMNIIPIFYVNFVKIKKIFFQCQYKTANSVQDWKWGKEKRNRKKNPNLKLTSNSVPYLLLLSKRYLHLLHPNS